MKHNITFVGENSDIEPQKERKVTAIFSTFTLATTYHYEDTFIKKMGCTD